MTALTPAQISQASWTPSSNLPLARPRGTMETMVTALRSDETLLIVKIAIVACPILIGHLIGTLVGNALLLTAVVVLPLTIWALFALHQLKMRESAVLDVAARFNDVKEALGGEEAFRQIPELRSAHYIMRWGISPPIAPEMLSHSVMRGTDSAGRPLICIKVCSIGNDEPFVNILHQNYVNVGLWSSTYWIMDSPEALAEIRSLVVDHNHPHLRLA